MTPEREQHLHDLKNLFLEKLDAKYRKGAEQHNESLLEKTDLLEEAFDEILDLFVYVATELERRRTTITAPEEPPSED